MLFPPPKGSGFLQPKEFMKIIISPAKQMKYIDDIDLNTTKPMFLDQTKELLKHIQTLDYETLKKYLKCSDKIAKDTFDQYKNMDLNYTSPAIFSYSGIQYQYMAPNTLTDDEIQYLQEHLYILSGFYGLVRPLDEIVNYRLEMQSKIPFSLYTFWKDTLANEIQDEILNLASEEYAKCLRKYKPLIDVKFYDENLKEKGVYAKMARGAMVQYLAKSNAKTIEDVKQFNELDYTYDPSLSNDTCLVFVKKT